MGNDDDFYGNFQCDGNVWHQIHLSLLYSDGGNIFVGLSRLFSFFLVFGLNWYNRWLLRNKAQENVNVVPGLVLPYYFLYIYLYIFLSFLCGIVDISTQGQPGQREAYNWVIPIEQALFHWLYEGLAFFLMRYGAGVKAIQKSLMYSFLWGLITFIFYFFIYSFVDASYGQEQDKDKAFGLFLAYQSSLFCFYAMFFIVPTRIIYRRPALQFYAGFNMILYITAIIVGAFLEANQFSAVCASSVIIFIEVAFLQPLVLFKTFQIDSQYWQGLTPGKGNPLADVWDHVDIRTAETMAEKLEAFTEESGAKLPILHFGLLDFNENAQFVAGGFSRVYFGTLRDEKVAFKILFAMELTPEDVQDFYKEASLLAALQHENVVNCKGICVMPPALTMVLEHCIYGSLYDFLYKPVRRERKESVLSTASSTIATFGNRIVSFFGEFLSNAPSTRNTMANEPLSVTPFGRPNINNQAQHNDHDHENRGSLQVVQNPLIAPLDISKAQSGTAGGSHNSNSISNSNSTNSTGKHSSQISSGMYSQSGNIELDHLPRPSKSAFDIDENGITNHSIVSNNGLGGERTSIIQRTVDRISGLFNTSNNQQQVERSGSEGGSRDSVELSVAHSVNFLTRLRMMRDAVAGIAFIHSKGFMHCDIKSLNFLVDEQYRVKVADMGEVRPIGAYLAYQLPPIPARNWAPPEVITPGAKPEHYTTASEVYGVTIVLCELITLELPFGDLPERVTPPQWYEKLVVENLRPALPANLDSDFREVLTRGMSSSPENRPLPSDLIDTLDDLIRSHSRNNDLDV